MCVTFVLKTEIKEVQQFKSRFFSIKQISYLEYKIILYHACVLM